MSPAFDTLKLADRLEAAGFSAGQARGTASALSEARTPDLATKSDLSEVRSVLKAEISEVRTALKAEISEVRTALKAEISEVRTDLKADIAEIRADILILKWMGGFMLALMVAVFVKMFVH